jgi:hypothetical protein
LTDGHYSTRLKDLMHHHLHCTETDLNLLKIGRHFRLSSDVKLVVGRTEKENRMLTESRNPQSTLLLKSADFPGPIGLVPNTVSHDLLELAGAICAGYSKAPGNEAANINVEEKSDSRLIQVRPVSPNEARKYMI